VTFAEHFRSIATQYAQFRPHYPDALVDILAEHCAGHDLAWDAGCGNGQLTIQLRRRFLDVVGSDPAPEQIALAPKLPHTQWLVATADLPMLASRSVDLAVAAQAAHWFHWPRYVAEVERVTKPGAVVALVSYGTMTLDDAAGALVSRYYHDTLASFWPPERRHIENGYRDLVWPWSPIDAPPVDMTATWSRDELVGYLSTWSATVKLISSIGPAPFEQLTRDIAEVWPDDERRLITWPLTIRMAHRS
jgi:SAM-dependent methyltransferase